jgi:glycosyltransferase involved in cell wall biosynthesis
MLYIIPALFSLTYLLLLYKLYSTWTIEETTPIEPMKQNYSILIPVRNESANIERCLNSLFNQNYDSGYEVILINDHSEDDTLLKAKSFTELFIVDLDEGISGKKRALAQGVLRAKYDNIITIDGDCEVGPVWLATIDKSIDSNTYLATGSVDVKPVNSFTAAYEHYDTMATMLATNLGIKENLFYLANGCNLYFKKELFKEALSDPTYQKYQSGDDVFLIKKAKELGKKVVFVDDEAAVVMTAPQIDLLTLISQRKRWSTKTKGYATLNLLILQGFVWLYALITLGLLLYGVDNPMFFVAGLGLLLAKTIGDYLFFKAISPTDKATEYYLPAAMLYFFMILLMGAYALFPSKYSWKGRQQR